MSIILKGWFGPNIKRILERKIWVVSELFYPDQVSTGYIITAIAEELAKQTPVQVICGPIGYTEIVEEQKTLPLNIYLNRVKVGNWNKNNLVWRTIRQVLLSVKMGYKLMRKAKSGDTVMVVTNPAPLLLLVSKICKWKKLKLVILVHDVFPENLIAANILSKRGLIYQLLLSFFNNAYQNANHLIVLGRDMKSLFMQKINWQANKITVIPNWADTATIYPVLHPPSPQIKLQFAGNFGRLQGLIPLLKAISGANNENLAVDFIGTGAMLNTMQSFVRKAQLHHVHILPPFKRNEQLTILNNCDACLVSLSQGMRGLGVPSKAYNILAAGKPIIYIGDVDSEIAFLIDEYDIGWKFAGFNEGFILFLQSLNEEIKQEMIRKGINARNLALNAYTKEKVLNAYAQLIQSIS
ncbi:MAG: glycosyltransferase family 4 protein [Bacteroidota bacterium]